MLDAAAQHTAAQKERIDNQSTRPGFHDGRTGEAVAAEAIGDFDGQTLAGA